MKAVQVSIKSNGNKYAGFVGSYAAYEGIFYSTNNGLNWTQ